MSWNKDDEITISVKLDTESALRRIAKIESLAEELTKEACELRRCINAKESFETTEVKEKFKDQWIESKHEDVAMEVIKKCIESGYTYDDIDCIGRSLRAYRYSHMSNSAKDIINALPDRLSK